VKKPRSAWPSPAAESCRAARLTGLTTMLAWLAALSSVLLAGCADMAGIAPKQALLQAPAAAAAQADWPQRNAWDEWNDPALSALIERGLQQQPNLQLVRARLVQAQAQVASAEAAQGLQVNGALDLTYQRFSENGLVPPPLAGNLGWVNQLRVDASWEWDLFGRQQAAVAAAIGQRRAAEAETQAASLLLAANIASAYVALARAAEAKAITQDALRQREQVLALVEQRIQAGLDTKVELRQAETQLAQLQTESHAADEQIALTRHALAELTGQAPTALGALLPPLAPVRVQALPGCLPADLLGRRADLVAQRWRVEAASRDVDVARAQFYPNINLVAFVGLSSIGLNKLVETGSGIYGAGPALRLPIFESGRLQANLLARSAEVDAAVDSYNAALLRALREVADQVESLRSIEQQQRTQAQAESAAAAAYDLAMQRYRAGLGTYLTVLSAETAVLTQRRAGVELKARHLLAEAALSRALGGGYRGELPGETTLAGAEPTQKQRP
jgi:NodT family efflux transporter outer membrane factor (OMF) lipoprotein